MITFTPRIHLSPCPTNLHLNVCDAHMCVYVGHPQEHEKPTSAVIKIQ